MLLTCVYQRSPAASSHHTAGRCELASQGHTFLSWGIPYFLFSSWHPISYYVLLSSLSSLISKYFPIIQMPWPVKPSHGPSEHLHHAKQKLLTQAPSPPECGIVAQKLVYWPGPETLPARSVPITPSYLNIYPPKAIWFIGIFAEKYFFLPKQSS